MYWLRSGDPVSEFVSRCYFERMKCRRNSQYHSFLAADTSYSLAVPLHILEAIHIDSGNQSRSLLLAIRYLSRPHPLPSARHPPTPACASHLSLYFRLRQPSLLTGIHTVRAKLFLLSVCRKTSARTHSHTFSVHPSERCLRNRSSSARRTNASRSPYASSRRSRSRMSGRSCLGFISPSSSAALR